VIEALVNEIKEANIRKIIADYDKEPRVIGTYMPGENEFMFNSKSDKYMIDDEFYGQIDTTLNLLKNEDQSVKTRYMLEDPEQTLRKVMKSEFRQMGILEEFNRVENDFKTVDDVEMADIHLAIDQPFPSYKSKEPRSHLHAWKDKKHTKVRQRVTNSKIKEEIKQPQRR
jgi:hypothetical protein